MTDLHTHILPGVDDGAANMAQALLLLEKERADGVDAIALTPHFNPFKLSAEEFLLKRAQAFDALQQACNNYGHHFHFALGAEVVFSPELFQMQLSPLCIDGHLLLLELPMHHYPRMLPETVYEIRSQGFSILLAHAERYPYFTEHPDRLYDLVEDGVYVQVNAGSLLRMDKCRRRVLQWMQDGYVHVVASDTHSMEKRPPQLGRALAYLNKKLGSDVAEQMEKNAHKLFLEGLLPDIFKE